MAHFILDLDQQANPAAQQLEQPGHLYILRELELLLLDVSFGIVKTAYRVLRLRQKLCNFFEHGHHLICACVGLSEPFHLNEKVLKGSLQAHQALAEHPKKLRK